MRGHQGAQEAIGHARIRASSHDDSMFPVKSIRQLFSEIIRRKHTNADAVANLHTSINTHV
jgi:hypothetical protein